MRAITVLQRSFDVPFLPDDLGDALRRRLREVAGVMLLGLTAAAVTALATWSVGDPSLSHATSAPVRNLLGMPGAITADLLMQLIGLASIALIVPIAAWGWRLTSHAPLVRELLRMCFWLGGALLATGFAACLPRTPSWPLPTGLGGVIGDLVLRVPAAVIGPLGGTVQTIIAVILGCAAVASVAIASGVGLQRPAAKITGAKTRSRRRGPRGRHGDFDWHARARVAQPEGPRDTLGRSAGSPKAGAGPECRSRTSPGDSVSGANRKGHGRTGRR